MTDIQGFFNRYAHEPELKKASRDEWDRLTAVIAALQPYIVPGTNLEVQAKGWPTLAGNYTLDKITN